MSHLSLERLDWLAEGPIGYADGWERQRARVAARQARSVGDGLILLEHRPTVSYGRAADPRFRRLSPADYAAHGIELIATDRGGDVTYHGPGQLVGYPIIHLGEGQRDLHGYVRNIEEVLIRTARDFGVAAQRVDWHAGVWTEDGGYLAAIGVRVARWVTHHGFALNVDERVQEGFATIVPCGQEGRSVVTLSALAGRPLSLPEVADRIWEHFVEIFGKMS